MTKAEQEKLIKLESQDRGRKAVNTNSIRKGFSEARQDIYNLSVEEQGAVMKAVGQDNFLVAAHNKGLGDDATVEAR